jgi:hypothetical protein
MKRFDHYQEEVITAVREDPQGYEIMMGSLAFYISKVYRVEPKVGDTIRLYGKGLGYPIRGVDINGKELYYRTPAQEQERFRQEQIKEDERKEKVMEDTQHKRDARLMQLPSEFVQRIEKFRGMPNFQRDLEPYELFVCEQAVAIAGRLRNAQAVEKFRGLSWDNQKALVPELNDGHSGNSFGAACYLATLYLTRPEQVKNVRGALSPIVGSKPYIGY